MSIKRPTKFESDLMTKLQDPEFAAAYIAAAIVENDMSFLPVALGDVAKAYGVSKLSETSGIHRRTLYKVFDVQGNPSFELVAQIASSLGLELLVRPKLTTSARKSKKPRAS